VPHSRAVHSSGRQIIAIGMPTISSTRLHYSNETAPLSIFLPSFVKTVNDLEWENFIFRFYIGFDQKDRLYNFLATFVYAHQGRSTRHVSTRDHLPGISLIQMRIWVGVQALVLLMLDAVTAPVLSGFFFIL
jgi:hypothetical protein